MSRLPDQRVHPALLQEPPDEKAADLNFNYLSMVSYDVQDVTRHQVSMASVAYEIHLRFGKERGTFTAQQRRDECAAIVCRALLMAALETPAVKIIVPVTVVFSDISSSPELGHSNRYAASITLLDGLMMLLPLLLLAEEGWDEGYLLCHYYGSESSYGWTYCPRKPMQERDIDQRMFRPFRLV